MQLSHAQKKHLFEHGYVKLGGVVPRVMVERARRAINASIGQGMNVSDMIKFQAQSFCPELQRSPIIVDLFNGTPVLPMLESVMGAGRVERASQGQVALRFPTMRDPVGPAGAHIDGLRTESNGVPQGQMHNFTALLGVYLGDVAGENDGNLTVWPGSHRTMSAYFRSHDWKEIVGTLPPVELGAPKPITGEAGDVILAHYLTAHGVTPNVSPNIRYAVFFRVHTTDFAETKWDSLKNPWLQWPGMQSFIEG